MTIFDFVSSIGIIGTLLFSTWQIFVARKAISAQSFLNLHQLEVLSHGKDGEDGIAAITNLKNYNDYAAFAEDADVPKSTRGVIYNAVVFLNFVATLSEEDYLKIQDAWDIYFMAYRISYDKLWHGPTSWWLDHHRESHPNIFPSFERACLVTHATTSEMSDAYDKKMLPQYAKRYKRASKLTKEQLRDTIKPPRIPISTSSKVVVGK